MCSFSIAGFSFRMFHGKIGIIRIRKAVFGSGNVGNVINLCCVFMCVNIVSHDIFYIISFGIPVIFPIDWYPKVNIQGTWSTKWRIFPTFDFDRCVKLGPLCDLRRLVVASKEQMSLLQGKLVEGGAERQQLEWLWRKLLMTIASCDYECLFSSSLRMIIRGVVIIVDDDFYCFFLPAILGRMGPPHNWQTPKDPKPPCHSLHSCLTWNPILISRHNHRPCPKITIIKYGLLLKCRPPCPNSRHPNSRHPNSRHP